MSFSVGDRVAVMYNADEDLGGSLGTVVEVHEAGGEFDVSVKLDEDDSGDSYGFADQELCAATGFMPGASDIDIMRKLLGRKVVYYNDLANEEQFDYVRQTNKGNRYFRVERFDGYPELNQIHFIGEHGFRSIYIDSIVKLR